MKKLMAFMAAFFVFAGILWACFEDDPTSGIGTQEVTIEGNNGSSVKMEFGWNAGNLNKDTGKLTIIKPNPSGGDPTTEEVSGSFTEEELTSENNYAAVSYTAFPVTLFLSYSGFLADDGTAIPFSYLTRMCLLYFSTAGKWVILKEYKNIDVKIDDDAKALFGKYTIQSSLGYKSGEIMPVLVYYQWGSYSNFDLDAVLASNKKLPLNNQVIGFYVRNNTKPY